MIYNERVEALAEKMGQCKLSDMAAHIREMHLRSAYIVISEGVEQFNNGWSCGVLHANNNDGYKRDDCLKRLGLIPDDGQEAGNDD